MTAQQPVRLPTADGIARAAAKIAALLPPTPLLPLDIDGVTIWCKAECLQPIGSFKIRGAWHRLSDLTAEERTRGVVGVSSGNHAQGVAWAAKRLGIAATIVMPRDAPETKLAATRALGAEIVLYDRYGESRDVIASELVARSGATLVHAFGDPWVIEGQGSVGVEMAAQMTAMVGSPPDTVVTCCGGGGLTAGIALAIPTARIIAVEPEGWDDVGRSLASGTIMSVPRDAPATACDALQTPHTYPINFAVLQARDVTAIAVSEAEVRAAQRLAASRLRVVLEPGGAVALAAVLAGKVALTPLTAITLSGGNVDLAAHAEMLVAEG